jgi:tRNA-specific 2-thiouridylase
MSGGVDSSVAAVLLKKQGYSVVGVFLKFWSEKNADNENRCCSIEAENRARKVAKILNIPFYVFNFEKEFKKRVVDCFLKEYKNGLTPNPCVVCNKEIKFGLLLEKALKMGADFIATGHYARVSFSEKHNLKLLKAKDKTKDQSYFLWRLNQKQLKHILFPIGDYTRKEVEEMAEKFKLPFEGVKKSQEICFIPEKVDDFLKNYLKPKPGKIIDVEGKILGKHEGLWFYTIGQRKGIGLVGGPHWVFKKDFKKNVLIVTKNKKDLYQKKLIAQNVNWVSPQQFLQDATGQVGKEPKLPLEIEAKIRYRHKAVSATIYNIQNTKYYIRFNKPQRAIASGQSVVFYKNDELLGGGVIHIN